MLITHIDTIVWFGIQSCAAGSENWRQYSAVTYDTQDTALAVMRALAVVHERESSGLWQFRVIRVTQIEETVK